MHAQVEAIPLLFQHEMSVASALREPALPDVLETPQVDEHAVPALGRRGLEDVRCPGLKQGLDLGAGRIGVRELDPGGCWDADLGEHRLANVLLLAEELAVAAQALEDLADPHRLGAVFQAIANDVVPIAGGEILDAYS